jgi:hypothetical protein
MSGYLPIWVVWDSNLGLKLSYRQPAKEFRGLSQPLPATAPSIDILFNPSFTPAVLKGIESPDS